MYSTFVFVLRLYVQVTALTVVKGKDERYLTMLYNDNDAITLPTLPLSHFVPSGRAATVFNKLVRQEDDSGVNHLWKGEMWPAQVSLIHARHVQNTRGAGANN